MSKKITIVLLLLCAAGLIGWDIYAAANSIKGDTISEVLLSSSINHPILPFAFGIIFGHLFWPQRKV